MWNKLKSFCSNSATYLLTYLCVLAPLLALSIVNSTQTLNKMRTDTRTTQNAQLTHIADQLDKLYATYEVTATNLLSLAVLDNTAMIDEGNVRVGIDQLKVVSASNSDTNEISLYYYDRSVVFSSIGKSDLRVHMTGVLYLQPQSIDPAISLYQRRTASVGYFPDSLHGKIIFHYPARYGLNGDKASLNFSVNAGTLMEWCSNLTKSCTAAIQLTFPTGEKLYMSGDGKGTVSLSSAASYPSESDARYTLLTARSARCGAELRVLYKNHELFSSVERMSILNLFTLTGGMVLGMLLCAFFSHRRSVSIQQMGQMLSPGKLVKNATESYVRFMISQVMAQNNALQSDAGQAIRQLKLQTSELLLHGFLRSEDEIRARLCSCGMELYDTHFVVMAITANPDDAVFDQLYRALCGDVFCKVTFGARPGVLVLMQLNNTDSDKSLRRSVAGELVELIASMGGVHAQIACSSVYSDVTAIGAASMEARYVVEQLAADVPVAYYEDFVRTAQTDRNTDEWLRKMRAALRVKSGARAEHAFNQMCSVEAERQMTPFEQKFVRHSVLYVLMQEIDRTDNTAATLVAGSVSTALPLEQFSSAVRKIIALLCVQAAKPDTFAPVLRYLEENCSNPTLSLSEVSDRFHINRSYLSTLFRERTGCTYGEYLTRLRLRRAHDMIVETDLNINEIIALVGYVDDGHFRRRFREIYHTTPTELRQSHTAVDLSIMSSKMDSSAPNT